jgi:hypothetical protein
VGTDIQNNGEDTMTRTILKINIQITSYLIGREDQRDRDRKIKDTEETAVEAKTSGIDHGSREV